MAKNIVVIEEWGVRFKPVEGLVGVEYGIHKIEGKGNMQLFLPHSLPLTASFAASAQTVPHPLDGLCVSLLSQKHSLSK